MYWENCKCTDCKDVAELYEELEKQYKKTYDTLKKSNQEVLENS